MEFYIPTDLAMAGNNAWVAAVAALAEREVGAVLPCFKDFELREWTDVRGMKQAMASAAPKMGVREFMWPSPHEFGKPKGLNWWMPLEAQIQEMVAADSLVLVQWLGPSKMTMEIEKYECVSGGSYRFISCDQNNMKYGFNGVMHEVTAPERIIRTFEFEGLPERGHVSLETATFEVLPGARTKLVIHSVFKSVEDRDGMVMAGMERGVVEGHDRLDTLLTKMN